eukprot:1697452-Alexandrium_andersonii.AAC.1
MSAITPQAAQRSPSTSTGRGQDARTGAGPEVAAADAGAVAGGGAEHAAEDATGGGVAAGGGVGA